jgi:hypothetical protein
MLHEFGQSVDVGDYDCRYPLHVASAEACVLAVSFLLGVSADPNSKDRWGGTPLDDALKGGTLYHRYCAKLLQAWGGQLGTFKDTKEGNAFLTQLESISIQTVRLLISKLIGQGFDRQVPNRMSDDDLHVAMMATVSILAPACSFASDYMWYVQMSSCCRVLKWIILVLQARHMPLVLELKGRLSVISEEIRTFSKSNKNLMSKLQEPLNSAISKLEQAALNSRPAVNKALLTAQDLKKVRPKTTSTCRPGIFHNRTQSRQTHEIKAAKHDVFSGLAVDSKTLDALVLECPATLHCIVDRNDGLRRTISSPGNLHAEKVQKFQQSITNRIKKDIPETNRGTMHRTRSGVSVYEISIHNQSRSSTDVTLPARFDVSPRRSGVDALLRPDVRPGNFSINLTLIQDCKEMVKNVEKLASKDDKDEGFLNSDDEMELYAEVDRMCAAQEQNEEKRVTWTMVAGQLLTRTALHIGNLESSWELLYRLLRTVADEEEASQPDPRLSMENVAHSLSSIRAETKELDLEQVLEDVHSGQKNLLWAIPREKQDVQGERVHLMNLITCSPSFRKAVLNMKIDENLCILMVFFCFFGIRPDDP